MKKLKTLLNKKIKSPTSNYKERSKSVKLSNQRGPKISITPISPFEEDPSLKSTDNLSAGFNKSFDNLPKYGIRGNSYMNIMNCNQEDMHSCEFNVLNSDPAINVTDEKVKLKLNDPIVIMAYCLSDLIRLFQHELAKLPLKNRNNALLIFTAVSSNKAFNVIRRQASALRVYI